MIGQVDAIIRKEYGIDPESIDFEMYTKLYAEWKYVSQINHDNAKAAIINAAAEILKAYNDNVSTNNQLDT